MRVSSIRRARWRRGRVNSGAEGRRRPERAAGQQRPRFKTGEACWPGGAGWRRVESRAEECSHARRQTCRRSERVAKRWRPRNARGASEGAGARGAGEATGGRSDRRGAPSREHPAGHGEPPSLPAGPGAARSSPEPHPGALAPPRQPGAGGVGGSARSRRFPPAPDRSADLQAEVPRACGPPGAATTPVAQLQPRPAGLEPRGRPGRRGRSARRRPRSRGESPGARHPRRGGRGPLASAF